MRLFIDTAMPIRIISKALLLYISFALIILPELSYAHSKKEKAHMDIYIAYTLKDKAIMTKVQEQLEKKGYYVKKYILDYLMLADYSSKNTIRSRFNKSDGTVIVTTDDVKKYIDINKLNKVVVVHRYTAQTIPKIDQMIRGSK